jgi:hypothetical protein
MRRLPFKYIGFEMVQDDFNSIFYDFIDLRLFAAAGNQETNPDKKAE